MQSRQTRRRFIHKAAYGAAGIGLVHVVPGRVLGRAGQEPPSEKVNIAAVGVGGRGARDIQGLSSQNIVALCDVDDRRAAGTRKKLPKAKNYRDFRRMLDQMDKQIDAVLVATPDHTHAVAAMAAIKRGKHVYCEKPLAHSIHEVRQLMAAARKHKVVTQLGNQGHSFADIRRFCEWVRDGAIGEVTEVHAACGAFKELYCQISKLPQLKEKHEVPKGLDWDLWLGPAQWRPYSPLYVPWNWRGWTPFGTGCIGDWVCHVVDPAFWALDLGAPTSVQAEVQGYDPAKHADLYPPATRITFEFPAKGKRRAVKLIWYDGQNKLPRPPELEPGRKVPGTGAIVKGTKGTIMHGSHGAGGVQIIPKAKMLAYKQPEPTIPRVANHYQDWLAAIRKGRPAGSNFDYGGPLTEIALVGLIAIRFPGQKLLWEAEQARFTNCPEANQYINPPYRDGWTL